ncbi:RNA polymerase sigma factor SigJ (plasmid) [Rhizobium sp. Pop5]|uniref:RNA polymerase sigma factor SigJ n=2 Tax=Rhizobium sp. Pop5 TaxID=1223565 RepID=UPI00215801AC|nr:RNA polymerase sigma factor SigJ [Rhizobium sp. Pop5]UVD59935.1 RNA polymerase sigma factor SigJ [Rhizobium sp. Pop5]
MMMDHDRDKAMPPALRRRLVRLAYRYLGSVSDAEDIVQDAAIKLLASDDVRDRDAWLARVVTNASLDRLRHLKARRETYIGPWLPEPIVEIEESPGDRELDISFAVMRTLETLSPLERAAFFLHDLFGMDFETVAATLGRSPAAVRKLASRARQAVKERPPRFLASQTDIERLLIAIGQAVETETIDGLAAMLTEDIELVSDGGGKVVAALRMLSGPPEVAAFLMHIARKPRAGGWHFTPVQANGGAGVLIGSEAGLDSFMAVDLDSGGRIAGIYLIRNPDKLVRVSANGTPAA